MPTENEQILAQILATMSPEGIEHLEDNMLPKLEVPQGISIQNALHEVDIFSQRLYEMHNNSKNNPIILNKIREILEMKVKLLGMFNVRPELKDLLDVEMNNYKRRFLLVALRIAGENQIRIIAEELTKEGL